MARPSVTQFLRVFQNRAQKFYDMSPDFFIEIDDQGCIESVNPAFVKATGYTESDVIRVPISHLVCVDDWAIFFRSFTNINQPPFRLLHKGQGYVKVFMAAPPKFEAIDKEHITTLRKWRATLILRVYDPVKL